LMRAAQRLLKLELSSSGIELKSLLIALAPFAMYLLVFKHYNELRAMVGFQEIIRPNAEILPYLEESVFQCLPHRKLARYASPFLDIFAAIPYLIHFPLPVLFGLYLFSNAQRRKQLLPFIWMAGWVNFLAVTVQFFFPTAPPWFTDSAVYDENDGTLVRAANNEAGFERLDILFNVRLFHSIYGASPVKFGAMPSLHVAWPAIICFSKPWVSPRFAIGHLVWISWAALYSNHHYGVDALGGICLVFIVYICMTRLYSPFDKRNGSKSSKESTMAMTV
jgi:membrane-associated phospholipid phosphatase